MHDGMPRTGYIWAGCLILLFVCAAARASDYATRAGQFGGVIGGMLGPLILASLVWFIVWLIRRRQIGYRPWVAVLAAGIGLVTALAQVGNRMREESEAAAAPMAACLPDDTRYGTEPKGFTYTPLGGQDKRDVLEQLEFDDPAIKNPHVVLAEGRTEDDILIFISIKRSGPQDDLDDYIAGARESGRPVRREQIGGREAAWVENEDGSRIATAIKGCHFLLVLGDTDAIVRQVAPAVFGT
jgi:hypothetical protein